MQGAILLSLLATVQGLKFTNAPGDVNIVAQQGNQVVEANKAQLEQAQSSIIDVLKANPQATPNELATLMQAKLQKDGSMGSMVSAAQELSKTTKTAAMDSAIIGVAVSSTGAGGATFEEGATVGKGVGPTATFVAFVNVGEGKDTRFCLGVRGGVSIGAAADDGPKSSLLVGGFKYDNVPGAAYFLGPSMGKVTALVSTKASDPTSFIGVVFPVDSGAMEMATSPEKASEFANEFVGGSPSITGNAMLGYTYCPDAFHIASPTPAPVR